MNYSNDIRLEQFHQLKNEIRGSEEYLVVGLDIAKEKHNAFFGTATGRTLHKGMFFDNTLEGFHKLFTQVEALQTQYGLPKVVFGMDPTANYHSPLAEHRIKCGHRVVLVSPSSSHSHFPGIYEDLHDLLALRRREFSHLAKAPPEAGVLSPSVVLYLFSSQQLIIQLPRAPSPAPAASAKAGKIGLFSYEHSRII